jgi:hypothetical protein
MTTTPNIVNPYDREKAALAQKLQERMIKVTTSKRKVDVTFTGGETIVFDEVDLCDTSGQCLMIYQDAKNKIYKYPIGTITRVVETLLEEKKT